MGQSLRAKLTIRDIEEWLAKNEHSLPARPRQKFMINIAKTILSRNKVLSQFIPQIKIGWDLVLNDPLQYQPISDDVPKYILGQMDELLSMFNQLLAIG